MAAVISQQHHHRNTTKVDHKPFKSKHATKSALKDRAKGKVEREDQSKRRTPHQQVMSKLDRRNKAKQLRLHHKEKQDHESTIFQGIGGAAKHIAVVPLSKEINVRSAIKKLNESVDVVSSVQEEGTVKVTINRFKRNLLYMPATTEILNALDICKLADWVIFLITADQQYGEAEDTLLRALEGQGITNVVAVVTDIEAQVPTNKRSKYLTEARIALSKYFADLDKLSSLENKSDCATLVRSFCSASTKGIRWRDDRSWMLIDQVRWEAHVAPDLSNAIVSGTVRGRGLNLDRLVHIQGWGEFKIKRAVEVPVQGHKRKANEMLVEDATKIWTAGPTQDDLAELAPEEINMENSTNTAEKAEHKGVLLDDHHYFSDDDTHIPAQPKKLPQGTSSYQAAWYLDDVSDSDSELMDNELGDDTVMDDTELGPEDGAIVNKEDAMTEGAGTEYPESEMHVDADEAEEARQLEEYRASRKQEAVEDLEFPDEIELHPNTLARERLAKYRGLKSLRTSEWNTAEDKPYEPQEYGRLLQIPDYKKSYSAAIKDALVGGIPAGTRIELELEGVPTSYQTRPAPASLYSLLRHEHKHAVVNLNMTLGSSVPEPVRSKEELIVQIGHRRFAINPIFSAAGVTPNDVHKFDRFLHPGRSAIATFTGPITWGSVPVLVFRRKKPTQPTNDDDDDNDMTPATAPELIDSTQTINSSELELIGTATTVPPSTSRVIAKRIILTGHPYKIHKKLVTIRYMFFNREDVLWFSALPLWTKRGRQGFVKEPLGTHGYFKATFDGVGRINAMDAVGVSLYKRVWPRACRRVG